MNVTYLENRVMADDQVKMKSAEGALIQYHYVLNKRENVGTEIVTRRGKIT